MQIKYRSWHLNSHFVFIACIKWIKVHQKQGKNGYMFNWNSSSKTINNLRYREYFWKQHKLSSHGLTNFDWENTASALTSQPQHNRATITNYIHQWLSMQDHWPKPSAYTSCRIIVASLFGMWEQSTLACSYVNTWKLSKTREFDTKIQNIRLNMMSST